MTHSEYGHFEFTSNTPSGGAMKVTAPHNDHTMEL